MPEMTHWDRVEAALHGMDVDHPPVSLWGHFPNRDQTAQALADTTLDWQVRFDFDFIKLMPPGDYATIDWGAESVYRGNLNGTRETIRYPIVDADDWCWITPLPVDRVMNREVVETVALVSDRCGAAVPVLQTIFSPLTIAMKPSRGHVIDHLRQRPDVVHEGLQATTDVTVKLVDASLERGASGIFFATQCARIDLLSVDRRAGRFGDTGGSAWFSVYAPSHPQQRDHV